MPGSKTIPIILSERQQNILAKIVKRHHAPQQLVKRSQLILLMAQSHNNQQAANQIGVHQETAKRWRDRRNKGNLNR